MRAAAYTIALILVATVASAQPVPSLAADAFHVTLHVEPDSVARRIEGLVHNSSAFRVTDVRLEVRGLDAQGRAVGRTFAWAIGDIVPGGDSWFVFDAMPSAVRYDTAVISYDLVSGPLAPEAL